MLSISFKSLERNIFYLTVLFLPTQLGRHFWPNFAFVSGIRVDYLSPTVYATDILIIVLFVIFSTPRLKKFRPRLTIYYLLFTIIILGVLLSKNQAAGFYGILKLLEFVFFGSYVAKNLRAANFPTIIFIFALSIISESLLAILQYINQGSVGGLFYFLGERMFNSQTPGIANASINGQLILRPYATFPHPNVLAGYLTITMTMALSIINYQISNIKKYTFIISLIIGSVALFLTMSRVAIVVWLVVLGFTVIVKLKQKARKTKFIIYYLLFIIFILLGVFIFSPIGNRFTGFNFREESFIQRQELINASLLMVEKNPLFGVGVNNFLVNLPGVQKAKGNIFYLQPVHNIYLLVAAETGLVGFVIFAWFIAKTFQRIKFQISDFKFQIFLAVLFLGFFDHYFLTLQQGQLIFSFVFGLVWAKLK